MNTSTTTEGAPSIAELVEMRRQVEARIADEADQLAQRQSPGDPAPAEFVRQCLAANELGDGLLFAALHRGQYVFEANSGSWFSWSGHFWERDVTGRALGAVETVAQRYLQESAGIARQLSAGTADEERVAALGAQGKAYRRRIEKLRSVRGRQNCLTMASTLPEGALTITGEKFDADPWLLGCQNGVVDLRSGQFRDGRPEDWITMPAAAPWQGIDAPAPTWEKFLLQIMDGDRAKVDYLQRTLGYGITGLTREHVFLIFFGEGRNGKGTLIEALQKVLGPLAGPIPVEMLLDQGRVANPDAPTASTMALKSLRLAFASETEKGKRFSSAKVKFYSGGDTLSGRRPHDRDQTTFAPTHLLILATNWKPKADPDDHAFWDRLHLVDYPLRFKDKPSAPNERPIDRTLEDKLPAEASGILAWLVRGCLAWQRDGLAPPSSIVAATASYRRDEDLLADWIEEKCLVDTGAKAAAKALYSSFKDWFLANLGDKPPSQKSFGVLLTRRFEKSKDGTGNIIYRGLELRSSFE